MPRKIKKAEPSSLSKSPVKEIVSRNPVIRDESKSINAPDLSMFKFEKKPHVKIEYEKDSPEKVEEESKGLWEPSNWKEFLINLRNMRSNNDAPVDTMGCHMTMDENAPPKVMRYQSLIALMLSSQTKDQVTFAAMERLREKGLTVDNVLKMSDEELGKLIYPVGFWKTKVKYIKKTTETLKEQYDSDIPDSVDKLCKLTGVGPKMAHICMQVAWNKTTGIGVDTHVHRISNRIGWVKKPTATPEDTRKALQSWLPFDLWSEVNHLMVGFGQTICQPVSPLCHECLNRDICPSSGMGRKSPSKKSPIKKQVEDDIKEEISITDQIKNISLVSPRKRKITPTKKNDLKITIKQDDVTLKVEDDPPASQKRKITPKKNSETLNVPKNIGKQVTKQSTTKSPSEKETLKKSNPKMTGKTESDHTLKDEDIPHPSRKRKVTPKKYEEATNEPENISKPNTISKSPIKRKTPTKNIPKTTNKKENEDNLNDDMSPTSRKRKITPKKNIEITNELKVVPKVEILETVPKSSNKRKVPAILVTMESNKQEDTSKELNDDQRDVKSVKKSPIKKGNAQKNIVLKTNDVYNESNVCSNIKNPTNKRKAVRGAKNDTINPISLDDEVVKNTKITRSKSKGMNNKVKHTNVE